MANILKAIRQLPKYWQALKWKIFSSTMRSEWPDDRYCTICDGRIWWWQKATRLYSLGMTRAHLKCAGDYLRSELEARKVSSK